MTNSVTPEHRVGHRLRFRDLQVFFAVVQSGSMGRAAQQLGLTQPAVSDIVAALEDMFGVRLFDRNSRGVEPTIYGHALLRRGHAAFDELKQGIRDIEFLSDPTAGFLKIGFPASVLGGQLSLVVERFRRRYPRAILQFDEVTSPGNNFPTLRNREHDLIVARIARPLVNENDLDVEILFQDPLVIWAVPTASGPAAARSMRQNSSMHHGSSRSRAPRSMKVWRKRFRPVVFPLRGLIWRCFPVFYACNSSAGVLSSLPCPTRCCAQT